MKQGTLSDIVRLCTPKWCMTSLRTFCEFSNGSNRMHRTQNVNADDTKNSLTRIAQLQILGLAKRNSNSDRRIRRLRGGASWRSKAARTDEVEVSGETFWIDEVLASIELQMSDESVGGNDEDDEPDSVGGDDEDGPDSVGGCGPGRLRVGRRASRRPHRDDRSRR